jgi:hypothetical protein
MILKGRGLRQAARYAASIAVVSRSAGPRPSWLLSGIFHIQPTEKYSIEEKIMISATATRVSENTSDSINEKNRRQIEENVNYYASAGPEAIQRRIEELDREWDIERVLEAHAGGVALFAVLMGILGNRKFLLFPAVIGGFLMQHAIQGWCPPLPIFRRLGIRSMEEINRERYALKALRGDFSGVEPATDEHIQKKGVSALEAVDR